ncbi:hypothetical protein PAAG_11764 [Paracoccidioides lutzii Pb01]|uniref:Ubiquitin-like protease family profile domain-containing protein n=1 Tax=Paracoccidioides lutzii (strain ATCC MYA-826 / Pb01) TaxID=502779 RepID=A0A0A2V589_PARBA|nr:hypothetical protein PAAG_11764 [Paracoccidioides lutzii Pb01]KGQ01527.1 hypothetical protein PAAG_11764 [Paracoccidioides lutzii Pb01]
MAKISALHRNLLIRNMEEHLIPPDPMDWEPTPSQDPLPVPTSHHNTMPHQNSTTQTPIHVSQRVQANSKTPQVNAETAPTTPPLALLLSPNGNSQPLNLQCSPTQPRRKTPPSNALFKLQKARSPPEGLPQGSPNVNQNNSGGYLPTQDGMTVKFDRRIGATWRCSGISSIPLPQVIHRTLNSTPCKRNIEAVGGYEQSGRENQRDLELETAYGNSLPESPIDTSMTDAPSYEGSSLGSSPLATRSTAASPFAGPRLVIEPVADNPFAASQLATHPVAASPVAASPLTVRSNLPSSAEASGASVAQVYVPEDAVLYQSENKRTPKRFPGTWRLAPTTTRQLAIPPTELFHMSEADASIVRDQIALMSGALVGEPRTSAPGMLTFLQHVLRLPPWVIYEVYFPTLKAMRFAFDTVGNKASRTYREFVQAAVEVQGCVKRRAVEIYDGVVPEFIRRRIRLRQPRQQQQQQQSRSRRCLSENERHRQKARKLGMGIKKTAPQHAQVTIYEYEDSNVSPHTNLPPSQMIKSYRRTAKKDAVVKGSKIQKKPPTSKIKFQSKSTTGPLPYVPLDRRNKNPVPRPLRKGVFVPGAWPNAVPRNEAVLRAFHESYRKYTFAETGHLVDKLSPEEEAAELAKCQAMCDRGAQRAKSVKLPSPEPEEELPLPPLPQLPAVPEALTTLPPLTPPRRSLFLGTLATSPEAITLQPTYPEAISQLTSSQAIPSRAATPQPTPDQTQTQVTQVQATPQQAPSPPPGETVAQSEATELQELQEETKEAPPTPDYEGYLPSNAQEAEERPNKAVQWLTTDSPMGRPVSSVRAYDPLFPIVPSAQAISEGAGSALVPKDKETLVDKLVQCNQLSPRSLDAPFVKHLTAAWETKVDSAMAHSDHSKLASTSRGEPITRRSLNTCYKRRTWLNDEVINAYLALIVDHARRAAGNSGRHDKPRYHAFSTFFFSNLRDKGYESVRRWASRAKIGGSELLRVEMIFVPIHDSEHWTLMVVRPVARTIEHFDSLGSPSLAHIATVKKWLRGELGELFVEEEWRVLPSISPQQDNGSDCGVFLLTTAKLVALGMPLKYGARDIPEIRKRIVAELINGGFDGDFDPKLEMDPVKSML